MFCKWCGKKLKNSASPCSSCGKSQPTLENGNGFWDLCSKEPQLDAPRMAYNSSAWESRRATPVSAPSRNNSSNLWLGLACGAVGLLLASTIAGFVGISKASDCNAEIAKLQAEVADLNEQIDSGFEKMASDHASQQTDLVKLVLDEDEEDLRDLIRQMPDTDVKLDKNLKVTVYYSEDKCILEAYCEQGTPIFWQKSTDKGHSWELLDEVTTKLTIERSADVIYRAVTSSYEHVVLYRSKIIGFNEDGEQSIFKQDVRFTDDELELAAKEALRIEYECSLTNQEAGFYKAAGTLLEQEYAEFFWVEKVDDVWSFVSFEKALEATDAEYRLVCVTGDANFYAEINVDKEKWLLDKVDQLVKTAERNTPKELIVEKTEVDGKPAYCVSGSSLYSPNARFFWQHFADGEWITLAEVDEENPCIVDEYNTSYRVIFVERNSSGGDPLVYVSEPASTEEPWEPTPAE